MASALDLLVNLILKDKYSKDLKKIEKQTKSSTKKMKDAWKNVGIGIAAAAGAMYTMVKALERAQQIERAETALTAYAGSAEEAARTTRMVQDAADGALSRFDAMQSASRLMAMGLANNAEEAAKLTEIAVTLGASMGKGPTQAFEEFSLMLANQSIPRLDTFGISSGRVRKRILELMSATEGLTREQAFMQAVMEDAEGKLIALDEAGFESSSSLDKLKAIAADLKDSLVVTIADGLEPFLDGLIKVREETRHLEEVAMATSSTVEQYMGVKLMSVHGAAVMTGDQIAIMRKHFEETKGPIEKAVEPMELYRQKLVEVKDATDDVVEANMAIVESLGDITAAELAREALAVLNEEMEKGNLPQEEYERLFRQIAGGMGEMSGAQIEAHLKLAELKSDFETGKTPLDNYIRSLENLAAQLDAISKKSITLPQMPVRGPYETRQFGGPVSAGMPYITHGLGEKELFIPHRSGRIERTRKGRDGAVEEMRKIRDDISWLVEQLPPTLRDVMLQEM